MKNIKHVAILILFNPVLLLYNFFYWMYNMPEITVWWVFPTVVTLIVSHFFFGAVWFMLVNHKLKEDKE